MNQQGKDHSALLSIYSAQRLRDREQSTLLTSGGMPLNGIAQSDKAGCQTTCFSHRIGRNIWQFSFNGYLY